MKTLHVLVSSLLLVLMASCGTTSKVSSEEMQQIEDMVHNRAFEFVAEWAMPLATNSLTQISNVGLLPPGSNINQINLLGNSNFIKIEGDSVSAYLSYYGERQMGGQYGAVDTGITFNGVPRDFNVVRNDKKNSYSIKFDINDGAEAYQVNMTLFPDLAGSVVINSNQRFSIRYQGRAQLIAGQ